MASPLLTGANLHQTVRRSYDLDLLGTHSKVYALAEALRARYLDYHDYAYYHILVGSTPCEGTRWDDFPGGELQQFLNELATHLESEGPSAPAP